MYGSQTIKAINLRSKIIFKSRFLKVLNPLERHEFMQLCNKRTYKAGEYIYYQGDPGTGMYFVESGLVELVVETGNDDDTAKKPSYKIEPPESFGALSIGYDMRRMSSARCIADTTVYGFFKPDLNTLCDRHPQIGIKILQVLNMIALKQLQITVQQLALKTDVATAHSLQFETYYAGEHLNEE
ncbi:MAG: Cyclic nucleotide-binding domain [Bacteroidetes bacterium HLUCCA01]|nr:MAG: Cyclic nucleotide-binding domain [Bacteroidetes bacterium HLUCCA01]